MLTSKLGTLDRFRVDLLLAIFPCIAVCLVRLKSKEVASEACQRFVHARMHLWCLCRHWHGLGPARHCNTLGAVYSGTVRDVVDKNPDIFGYKDRFYKVSQLPAMRCLTIAEPDASTRPEDDGRRLQEMQEVMTQRIEDWKAIIADRKRYFMSHEEFLQIHLLLTAPNVYVGNTNDLSQLSNQIDEIAQIDRLPKTNTLETMYVIRQAWDQVDIYMYVAYTYKRMAVWSFILLLVVGVAIVTITVISTQHCADESCTGDRWISTAEVNHSIIGLSLFGTITATVTAIFSPIQNWQLLRSAALSMESIVWQYRTRTGQFRAQHTAGSDKGHDTRADAEKFFYESVDDIKEQVAKSSTIQETTLFYKFDRWMMGDGSKGGGIYKHGQYAKAGLGGTNPLLDSDELVHIKKEYDSEDTADTANKVAIDHTLDDHHSPLRADAYLLFRVRPTMRFYGKRIPKYYRSKVFNQTLLAIAALTGTLLPFLGYGLWTAVASAIAGAATSWLEFHSTKAKLQRYSDTLAALRGAMLWWSHLPAVDQANLEHVNRLVTTCEDVINREREAWATTSLTTKMMASPCACETCCSILMFVAPERAPHVHGTCCVHQLIYLPAVFFSCRPALSMPTTRLAAVAWLSMRSTQRPAKSS